MYKFIQSPVKINSKGGFSYSHCMFNANGSMKLRDSALGAGHNANYPTFRIVRSMIGMMTADEYDYARIDDYNKDCLVPCGMRLVPQGPAAVRVQKPFYQGKTALRIDFFGTLHKFNHWHPHWGAMDYCF